MGTMASLVDWITTATGVRDDTRVAALHGDEQEFQLRALPNEEVYFYVKEVDNSRIMPRPDLKAAGACWRYIGLACVTVMALVAILLPIAYHHLAGYRIHELKQQRERLLRERADLDAQESALLSPARLSELAVYQQLVDPAPTTALSLAPAAEGALALKRK